jgi:hypothetical protein
MALHGSVNSLSLRGLHGLAASLSLYLGLYGLSLFVLLFHIQLPLLLKESSALRYPSL